MSELSLPVSQGQIGHSADCVSGLTGSSSRATLKTDCNSRTGNVAHTVLDATSPDHCIIIERPPDDDESNMAPLEKTLIFRVSLLYIYLLYNMY